MKKLLSRFKTAMAVGAISIGLVGAAPTYAVEDVLDTPAAKTQIAHKYILLDVAKAGNRLVAVGGRGHIVYSDDQGMSWTQAKVPVSVLLTGVSFVDAQYGWAVGHSGVVLKTSDGGLTWTKQFDGNQANKMIVTQAENYLARMQHKLDSASEDEREDIEYELEEAGYALEDAKLDAQVGASKPLLDVLFWSRKEGFVVGAYGYLFKTNDGGLTWNNYGDRIENPDRFHLNAIGKNANGSLFIVGEAGVVFRSQDNGESWESIDSPYEGSLFAVSGTQEAKVVLVGGLRGHLFRSEDDGDSWEKIETGSEGTIMGITSYGANKVSVVGNSGVVLYSQDGGRHFRETIREDRLGNTASLYLDSSRMVVVGESGVKVTSPSGLNL